MSEVLDRPIITTRFMDGSGHSSWGWDASDDVWVIPLIQQKMDEGYVFWIVEENPHREIQLRRVQDIGATRRVIIKDTKARELFEQGKIGIVTDKPEMTAIRRAVNAQEAARNPTVAHRSLGGG